MPVLLDVALWKISNFYNLNSYCHLNAKITPTKQYRLPALHDAMNPYKRFKKKVLSLINTAFFVKIFLASGFSQPICSAAALGVCARAALRQHRRQHAQLDSSERVQAAVPPLRGRPKGRPKGGQNAAVHPAVVQWGRCEQQRSERS